MTYRFTWNGLEADTSYKWRGFLQSLTVGNGCGRDIADAQTNAQSPQWAYFNTLPLAAKPVQYSLLLHTTGPGGTLVATPPLASGQTRYQPGTKVTVTAQPSAGYQIKTLTVDGVAATSPTDVVMSQDHGVEAEFTATTPGADGGVVDPDGGTTPPPNGGNGGGGCAVAPGGATNGMGLAGVAIALALVSRRRRR